MKHKRIPTDDEYQNYDGEHCKDLWQELSESWCCPGGNRSKREILRWTRRTPKDKPSFYGWIATLAKHHDHSTSNRFPMTIICGDCNSADGQAKKTLNLPSNWSFSAAEIQQFVTGIPHGGCHINYQKAKALYDIANEHTLIF